MATLYDGLVAREKVWRGAGRVVVADPDVTTFPDNLEDIINLSTYALSAGWSDVGPTTEDGVKIRREIATFDGIAVDQLKTKLDEGEPENTTMSVEMTLLHNDLSTLAMVWEGNTPQAIAEVPGVNVAQHSMALDPPVAFTERIVAVIQRDDVTGRRRAIAFRKAIPQVEDEIGVSSGEASELPFKLACKPDTTVDFGDGMFGTVLEEFYPADVPLAESNALIALYVATAGALWTDNDGWITDHEVGNWAGITVSGGHVVSVSLPGNGLDGAITDLDLSALSRLQGLDLDTNADLDGDFSTVVLPASLQTLAITGSGVTYGAGGCLTSVTGLRSVDLSDNALLQASVENIIADVYAGRAGYTYAAPALDVSGTNAAPSGTYQQACPPTSPLEQVHQLENDGCAEGINTWTITYTV